MILPSLILPSRVNQHWQFSGLDSIKHCRDKKHFRSYPHAITYNYNSRGFRDQEWPQSTKELENAIWCIGDSFTVGLGSPVDHTWPSRLSKITGHRVINVSMDGASNEWISKTAEKIIQEINPRHLTVMWSYTHRRELADFSLNDEQRRSEVVTDPADNWKNFLDCKEKIDSLSNSSVQFLIPNFHHDQESVDINACWQAIQSSGWPPPPKSLDELNSLPDWLLIEIDQLHHCLYNIRKQLTEYVLPSAIQVDQQDLARDGHHFDLITADWVATRAAQCLNLLINSKS